jgi:glycosyltransferase involved in cell wall biosynthesis
MQKQVNPTRLLLAIDNLLGGGKERQFLELVKGLSRLPAYSVEVVIFHTDVHFREIFDLGLPVTVIDRKAAGYMEGFVGLAKLLHRFRPQLVHSWHPLISAYIHLFRPFYRFRFIEGSVRAAAPKHLNPWFDYHAIRISSSLADATVANSMAGLSAYRISRNPHCIHNGFDLQRSDDLTPPAVGNDADKLPGTLRVGMVGNFTAFKDYQTYFTAAEQILRQSGQFEFYGIGTGPDLPRYRDKYRSVEAIRLPGRINRVEQYISTFDICVLCSTEYGEGISNAILEYMSLKKPVVALDCPGNREIIHDEVNGLFYRLRNPDSLARQILRLAGDARLREQLGQAGYETVKTTFSYENMITSFIQLYDSVVRIDNA